MTRVSQKHLRRIIQESCAMAMDSDQFADDASVVTGDVGLARKFEQEASAKSAALASTATLADRLGADGTPIDDRILSGVYVALLRISRFLQGRTISGRYEDAMSEFEIEPATVEDAWHPSEVEARQGAWAGGDNLEDALDHAEWETGEGNAGPHVMMREGRRRVQITLPQLASIVSRLA